MACNSTTTYRWQNQCGSSCAETLGVDRMKIVDQTGCDSLPNALQYQREKNTKPFRYDFILALEDKEAYLKCP